MIQPAAGASVLADVERPGAQPVPRAELRKEIQGLRALAVVCVVCFHVSPAVLPGGFVGVDVFFVISGYLITDLLLREVEATGRVSIGGFYARRVKRLLPIATVVILTIAASIGFVPAARWGETAGEMKAAALYYENWFLAERAVDYFSPAGNLAPLRHYWSLSVEEQYCIVWPLLLVVGRALGAFRRDPRRSLGFVVAAVAIASLAWSIEVTASAPRPAYFSTFARTWEFAVGALLACFEGWKQFGPRARNALGPLGLAAIAAAAFRFDVSTRVPGYAALVPAIGAALVIGSRGAASKWSPNRLLETAPAQYLGDRSYSLYLWHWPILVYLRSLGSMGGMSELVLVGVVSTALAHQSKDLIEDPFRRPAFAARRVQPLLLAACSILLVGLAAKTVRWRVNRQSSPAGFQELIGSPNYPGARTLTEHVPPADRHAPYLPRPTDARYDAPNVRPPDRWVAESAGSAVETCRCGDPASAKLIVVIGDSHAQHWLPALAEIAERRRWRAAAIIRSCPFADVPKATDGALDQACVEWAAQAMDALKRLKPDVVLIGQTAYQPVLGTKSHDEGADRLSVAYEARWKELQRSGFRVAVFRDTPNLNVDVPDCLSARTDNIEACSNSRERALGRSDPILMAAERTPGVKVIDMNDAICGPEICWPVVGNVLVWRDSGHLTASYARTIAPALEKELAPFVERDE